MVVIRGITNYPSEHFVWRAGILICQLRKANIVRQGAYRYKWELRTGSSRRMGAIINMRGWDQDVGQEIK